MNPLELVDYLVAGTTLLIGIAVGRRMRPKPPEPLRPICSCTHGYGTHDNDGKCQSSTKRANGWDPDYGHANSWEVTPCPCLRYDGPSPTLLGLDI